MNFSNIINGIRSHWKKVALISLGVVGTVSAETLITQFYQYLIPDLNDTKEIIVNQETKFNELKEQISKLGTEGKISPDELIKIEALLGGIKVDTDKISSITKSLAESQDKGYCSTAASGGVVVKEGGAYKFSSDINAGIKRIYDSGASDVGYSGGGSSGVAYLVPGQGTYPFISDGKSCRVVYLGSDDKQTGALTVSCVKKEASK